MQLNLENEYKSRLAVAMRAAKVCVFEADLTRQLYTFFENAEMIFGIPDEEILAAVQPYSALSPEEYQRAVTDYFAHPDDTPVIQEAFARIFRGESATYKARMKAGQSGFIWCKLDVAPVLENGRPVRMIGVITDISTLKQERDLLEQKTYLDGFTGLKNKEYSILSIKAALEREPQARHALILADIDRFKHFNDTYGHLDGDMIIAATARQFAALFREENVVGRFGGDEFIIFVRDVQDLRRLRERVQRMVEVRCEKHVSTNSVGIALYPADGTDYETLFKQADRALYRAKVYRGSVVFSPGADCPADKTPAPL